MEKDAFGKKEAGSWEQNGVEDEEKRDREVENNKKWRRKMERER